MPKFSQKAMPACIGAASDRGPPFDASEVGSTTPEVSVELLRSMQSMQPTRPGVVRGIPVFQVLQHAPQYWRQGLLDTLHRYSSETTEIDEFWSHSWHGSSWMKYLTILFISNGMPAFAMGMLGIILAFVLFVLEVLPPWVQRQGEPQSRWCALFGIVFHYLTLLGFRRQRLAFLDIACIDQENDALKTEGILSLGAILKNSRSLDHSS